MVREWFGAKEEKTLPSISIFLSVLLGFGSLYAIWLKFENPSLSIPYLSGSVTSKTYDIFMRVLFLPDYVAPLWNIGLPVFFALVLLLKVRLDGSVSARRMKVFLIAVLVAIGYLGHVTEVIVFIAISLFYRFFLSKHSSKDNLGLSLLLGLAIVAIIDLVAPTPQYLFVGYGERSLFLPYALSLVLSVLITIADLGSHTRKQISRLNWPSLNLKDLCARAFNMVEKIWKFGRWPLLFAYFYLIIIWINIFHEFDVWKWGGFWFTPIFIFPLRIGAVGVLAISAFSRISREL